MGVRITAFACDEVTSANAGASRHLLALHERAGQGGVRLLSEGHRRWWIGSFLVSCRLEPWRVGVSSPSPADLALAERLLARLLCGYDCGAPLEPCSPLGDLDQRLAVFTPDERGFMAEVVRERLAEPARVFARPPGPIGIAPDSDADWDGWVRAAAREIFTGDALSEWSLLTFIG